MNEQFFSCSFWHDQMATNYHKTFTVTVCLFVFFSTLLQEGFILGESKIEEQVTISDSQADNIHIEEIYSEFDQ